MQRIVVASSLELNIDKYERIKNPLSAMHRAIYLPTLNKRKEITKQNSDVIIEHFKHEMFNFNNWAGITKFYSKSLLEEYYAIGKRNALKKINKIKQLLN